MVESTPALHAALPNKGHTEAFPAHAMHTAPHLDLCTCSVCGGERREQGLTIVDMGAQWHAMLPQHKRPHDSCAAASPCSRPLAVPFPYNPPVLVKNLRISMLVQPAWLPVRWAQARSVKPPSLGLLCTQNR